jgi:hypothetical protein
MLKQESAASTSIKPNNDRFINLLLIRKNARLSSASK